MRATEKSLDTCTVCGREMSPSAKWGPQWLIIRYCSQRCSERRLAPLDYRLEEAILQLLGGRANGDPLSLDLVARFVDPMGWQTLMDRAENAARRLAAQGRLRIDDGDGQDLRLVN